MSVTAMHMTNIAGPTYRPQLHILDIHTPLCYAVPRCVRSFAFRHSEASKPSFVKLRHESCVKSNG